MTPLVIALNLMTVVAVAALLLPLLRRKPEAGAEPGYELGVYKDQLAEIERDRERGLIGAAEAEAARIEIERRILRAAARRRDGTTSGGRFGRAIAVAAALALPVLAGLLYTQLGRPDLPDQPFAARERAPDDPERPSVDAMVARLEERLAVSPNDLDGWLMLGRSRGVLGQPEAATAAYRKALELAPNDPRALAGLGEALIVAAGGVVTPEAKTSFTKLLEVAPSEPRARYYLGIAAAQAGDNRQALEHWRALLAESPAEAPWRPRVVEAFRETARELGLDPEPMLAQMPGRPAPARSASTSASGGSAAPAPTPEDVARVEAMAPEERAKMIRGMVERLEDRLRTTGGDAEGWRRLAQARQMLGEPDAARAAWTRALALAPDDPAVLKGYAGALLGPPDPKTALPAVSDEALRLYEKAAALTPSDPEPWWYLGIRALQDGRPADARADWQRVLTLLDPAHPEYATVKARLDALGG